MLEHANSVDAANCHNLDPTKLHLDLEINFSAFKDYTLLPLYLSNMFTRNISGTLDPVPDFHFYNFARTALIAGLPTVFSVPLAFTRGVFLRHDLFAPDAVNKNETIITVDLSDSYDYTKAGSLGEWYTVHANKKFDNVKNVTSTTIARLDINNMHS